MRKFELVETLSRSWALLSSAPEWSQWGLLQALWVIEGWESELSEALTGGLF